MCDGTGIRIIVGIGTALLYKTKATHNTDTDATNAPYIEFNLYKTY